MRLIAKAITISRAKLHATDLQLYKIFKKYASLVFGTHCKLTAHRLYQYTTQFVRADVSKLQPTRPPHRVRYTRRMVRALSKVYITPNVMAHTHLPKKLGLFGCVYAERYRTSHLSTWPVHTSWASCSIPQTASVLKQAVIDRVIARPTAQTRVRALCMHSKRDALRGGCYSILSVRLSVSHSRDPCRNSISLSFQSFFPFTFFVHSVSQTQLAVCQLFTAR